MLSQKHGGFGMRLYAQLPENRQGLTEWLSEMQFPARETQDGSVLVQLPFVHPRGRFLLPPVEDAMRFMIECHERGSGYWGMGTANIICGLSGRPLKPRQVPRSPDRCNFDARFIVPHDVVTILANAYAGRVTIRECRAVCEGDHGFIACSTLHHGDHQRAPVRYRQAVAAVMTKAAAYNRHTPFYIANGR
jgi:hypothetical protein